MQNAMEKDIKRRNALIMKAKLAYRRNKWQPYIYTGASM